MNSVSRTTPARGASMAMLAAVAAVLAGCSSVDNLISGDRIDYRSKSAKLPELEVPPDLTQLAREGRYQPQALVVSANAIAQQGNRAGAAPTVDTAAVAPSSVGDTRIERDGQTRWLVSARTPEQLWPTLHSFWEERGFIIDSENAQAGVMETDWAENRAKLPQDIVRNTLGKVVDLLFSTNTRDRFQTRVERAPGGGSEIYITHRGVEEVLAGQFKDSTKWQNRPSDPALEAEMLGRLMVRLGAPAGPASVTAAVSKSPATAATNAAPAARKPGAMADSAILDLGEGFDRAWRQVGLALDRSGFTVEDRDRSAGLYFVRYADPTQAGKEEPNFIMKFFSREKVTSGILRYRVVVKTSGALTQVSVQDSKGVADNSENARRIVGRLQDELRR